MNNLPSLFDSIDERELKLCLSLNKVSRNVWVHRFFALISRAGNGLFWYALMAGLLASYGEIAWPAVNRMLIAGVVGILLYKLTKNILVRERPYIFSERISLGEAPMDRYSFPSGHTLHAVSFTIIVTSYFPTLTLVLVPMTLLVAFSRVILGLHYPSDVVAGGIIGAVLAVFILA